MFPYLLLWILFTLGGPAEAGATPDALWCETPALCGQPPEHKPPIGDECWPHTCLP